MGRKSKFSKEIRVQACEDYLSSKKSANQISDELSIYISTIGKWVNAYKTYGQTAFDIKPRNKSYSRQLKLQVVKEYLIGGESLESIALKYNISSKAMVSRWVMLYNNGKEIKDYNPKGEVYTMKARHTTFEERFEIVKFVLDHDKDYKLAAEKFLLPYSLVYQWVQKYIKKGEETLKYQKKGPKQIDYIPEDISEKDKLFRENELLRRQLEYVKLENEVLKKKNN
jgi:transposase-like protein